MSLQTTEIIVLGIELVVDYEYDKGEPMVMYYPDLSGHPGSPPSVELHGVFLEGNDQDIYDLLSESCQYAIEERILESYE